MSGDRVLAGVVLFLAMFVGCAVWASSTFIGGAVVFIIGAIGAGMLHNRGDKAQRRRRDRDE